MSYSSLLSMAASGESSSSLDVMTSQFAHLPSRRKDAFSSLTSISVSASNSVVKTAMLTPNGRCNNQIHAKLVGTGGDLSARSDASNSQSFSSNRFDINNSIQIASSTPFHTSDVEFSSFPTASSSFPTASSSFPTASDSAYAPPISTSTGSSTPSVSSPPVTSFFAPAESLTIPGSGAGKTFLPALTKPDYRSQSGEPNAGPNNDKSGGSSPPAVQPQSIRVETVEWHMLDKRKFYPMSTTCSFMIRGMLYPITLIKTRIQIQEHKEMYKGTWDALRKIHASEGVGGFYRGFWVNSIQVFSGIFYISTYEGVRHLLATQFDVHDLVFRAFVGGLCASVVGQMITVPFDVVSQHMMLIGEDQRPKSGPKKLKIARRDAIHVPPEALKTRFGAFQTIVREIRARDGIPGYYKGYWISIGTYAPNSALWWGFYHYYVDILSQMLPVFVPALMVQSCSAPAAGLSAAVLTNPIDVVRARVQVEGNCTARQAAMRLWQEERYKMFTKGLTARFIQSSFFSFLIILGYETVKRLSLKEEYKNSVPW